MSLLDKYKNRESDKNFTDLKQNSKTYIEDQTNTKMTNKHLGTVDKNKIDVKLFNKIYEQNKLWDNNDDGHGTWFTSEDTAEPANEIFGNKFNLNVFNSTFEDYKDKLNVNNVRTVQKYEEPQALVSCNTGFTDIDVFSHKINDFSKPLPISCAGNSKSSKDLAYTDLKTAYTSQGLFIDPKTTEYKKYKNIDELKTERGNINYNMTSEQQSEYDKRKYRELETENNRQNTIRQRDVIISNNYSKTHINMLGYQGTAPS